MPLFRKQSAAQLPSLEPHDSKARLLSGRDSPGFMAKPCTPHLITRKGYATSVRQQSCQRLCNAQRVQSFKLQTRNVRGQGAEPLAFSWGSKGAILSRERMAPLSVQRHRRCLSLPRRARETPSPVGQIKKVQLFLKNPLDKWAPRAIMQPTSEELQTYDGEK